MIIINIYRYICIALAPSLATALRTSFTRQKFILHHQQMFTVSN